MDRYSAKLLFQFRVDVDGIPAKRRLCEERIVVIKAANPQTALKIAKQRGASAVHNYTNDEGNKVYFEFIGVMDLLHLGLECEEDEVWYHVCPRILPMERRDRLIPAESELSAVRNTRQKRGEPGDARESPS